MAKLSPERKKLFRELFEIWEKLCPMTQEEVDDVFSDMEDVNINMGGEARDMGIGAIVKEDEDDERLVREVIEEVEAEIRAAQENQ